MTQYIPHGLLEDASFVDFHSWKVDGTSREILKRISQIPKVVEAATVLAPAPGELSPVNLALARYDRLQYYVDEAGDPNLFAKRGAVNIGTHGCSRSFILGAVCIEDYQAIEDSIKKLRAEILTDPSLAHIESLKPERKRTYVKFHACKDHALVRERVFRMLATHDVKVLAVVRRKANLHAAVVAKAKGGQPVYAWQKEYDSMIARLFTDRLHLARHTEIFIAQRGKSNRDIELRKAVSIAKDRFERKRGLVNPHDFTVQSGEPANFAGLQVVDYYLWALQRVFEKGDFEWYNLLDPAYRLIVDVDDHRRSRTGVYYGDGLRLTPQRIKPFEG